jgi:hypothetical protein
MTTKAFVLPGDYLDPELIPTHATLPLKLGPGLRHIPPSTITPTVSGQLCSDARKNAIWVESSGGRVGTHSNTLKEPLSPANKVSPSTPRPSATS